MNDLRVILKQVCVTALYVTHDQEEAFAIGDRVAIMRGSPGPRRRRPHRAIPGHATGGLSAAGERDCGALPGLSEPC